MEFGRRWVLAIFTVVVLLPFALGGVTEEDSGLEQMVTIAEAAVLSAAEAVERAQTAGEEEADQLAQFLTMAEAMLVAFEEAQNEAAALVQTIGADAARIHEIAAIAASAEEDGILAQLVPATSLADLIAAEAVAKAQAALQRAAQATQEARVLVNGVAYSMIIAIAPVPYTGVRQQASLAQEALADAQAAADQVAQAAQEGDLETTVVALSAVVEAQTIVWEATNTAEAALNQLVAGVDEWLQALRWTEQEVVAAVCQVTAASDEASAVLSIMESLVSSGLVSVASEPGVLQPEKPDGATPIVQASDLEELVSGNSAFAFDLYQALRGEAGNLFYSPYSISLALGRSLRGGVSACSISGLRGELPSTKSKLSSHWEQTLNPKGVHYDRSEGQSQV